MHRRRNLWLAIVAALLAANLTIGYRVHCAEAAKDGESEAFEKISVMMRVLHLIRQDYVDEKKIDFSDLIYNALKGMVSSLDPFSGFLTPGEYGDMMESTEGEFGGLGIVVTVRDGLLTIVTPIEDTPGSRAGLRAGDQIIRIEDLSTEDMDLHEAVKHLKGQPGTEVTITIRRASTNEIKRVTIVRAIIEVPSVKGVCVLDGGVGYLRITQFNEPTAEKLDGSLATLEEAGISSLVIDLRNNPGGLLSSAVEASSLFLAEKRLVVFTEGRRPSQKREYFTDKRQRVRDLPIVILVNGGSASAAEIMAGCLQDWGRAVLVGAKTFGKGSVQNVIELPDGSGLRLTTSMYYTPSKRVIHEHGIEPDIEVELTEDELRAFLEGQDSAAEQGRKEPHMDRQLQRAIDTLQSYGAFTKGRKAKFKQLRASSEDAEPAAEAEKKPAVKPE